MGQSIRPHADYCGDKLVKRAGILVLSALALSACATGQDNIEDYMSHYGIKPYTLEQFPHCRGYGCRYVDQVALNKAQWKNVSKPFRPGAKTAEKERTQIAKAIAVFEQEVGRMTGTNEDIYGTFQEMGAHQLDCVDESTNTTIYLDLLARKGLLKFHTLGAPVRRAPIGRWPHQTATIIDSETQQRFAVDSWFHDNGIKAEIVPLDIWEKGWKPDTPVQNSE
ncbi:MAG: hypothetical protein KDJ35_09605 [Alphaproteobacteria bacterium]|nr:hypothetical protein [Alphaproteobacteria bacterium]